MPGVNRRSFVTGSAGVIGLAGAGLAAPNAFADRAEPALTREEAEILARPVLVRVLDASTAEVELLVGERSVTFTDRSLVARILRTAGGEA